MNGASRSRGNAASTALRVIGVDFAFIMEPMRYLMSSLVLVSLVHAGADVRANPDAARGALFAAPRATVVTIMKDAGQVLLWDASRGEYVVVRVGDTVQQFKVEAIEAEQVVLTDHDGKRYFILQRAAEPPEGRARPAAPATRAESGKAAELLDPYPSALIAQMPVWALGELPIEPQAGSAPIRTVVAPAAEARPAGAVSAPGTQPAMGTATPPAPSTQAAPSTPAGTGTATAAQSGTATPAPATALATSTAPAPATPAPAPSPAPAPAAVTPPAPATAPAPATSRGPRRERYTVSRREFDAAVADFHRLSKEIQLSLVNDGVRVDEVARGSLFQRWGLRAGDLVLSVDGQRIRGVDDAALIYARLMMADRFVVALRRGGDPVDLEYTFSK